MFHLSAEFKPCGDQPEAIERLSRGIQESKKAQVLLGVTGSGKTFTMANVIARVQKPTLIIAHNKTLAAQLYQEFKTFFPENAVEYFVSYYDYYQPEAYIPRTDTYIEKDMAINDRIERLRLSATRSLIEREDVIIVASCSCIYGLGLPEYYRQMNLTFVKGTAYRWDELLLHLVEMRYTRNDIDFSRGTFRVRGDVIEIFPAYEEDVALRVEFFDQEVEKISWIDPLTGRSHKLVDQATLYPGSHHVTPEEVREHALETIKAELQLRLAEFEAQGKHLERERLLQRTMSDLEMIREVGTCKGIENYSRHFSQRNPGDPPPCLIDYFGRDFLCIIDESHQTIPQLHAMYHGDRSRKRALVDYGFRLPSARDNRPLKFEETYSRLNQVIYVSATPSQWEIDEAGGEWVEQLIRPTGLLDPLIQVLPAEGQVDHALKEIRDEIQRGGRVLVTTLTKRLAEDLTGYLKELLIKAKYLHSDIDTLERTQIIRELRTGGFDVLVGINLLREGLDIPEVTLVAILDADKEGFLRSETSLIQTCGRAARNAQGRVIMYAQHQTAAIRNTLAVTERRRAIQQAYNKKHGIIPKTTARALGPQLFEDEVEQAAEEIHHKPSEEELLTLEEVRERIAESAAAMRKAAKEMRFEEAAQQRDRMRRYQALEVMLS